MSDFSVDWLNLREHADMQARDEHLRSSAIYWLQRASSPTKESPINAINEGILVDLGAGTGSTLRALSRGEAELAGSVTWRLVDQDRLLLTEAQERHGHSHRLQLCQTNLAHITELPLEGASLITASALFDLVSEQFLTALVAELESRQSSRRCALYSALNYDGTTLWSPGHSLDSAVLEAFNRDQRRDKGFGPALGPAAVDCLQKLLSRADFQLETAKSPWMLTGRDDKDLKLMQALIEGIAAAVAQDSELDARALAEWKAFRLEKAAQSSCDVGHTDLLALPA